MEVKFLQKIVGRILKADKEFGFFEKNDIIGVGVSGGKDSLILLEALGRIKKFLNFNLKLFAITVDVGFFKKDQQFKSIEKICEKYDISHIVKKTKIKEVVFEHKKQKNPCSLCSTLRKGALNDIAKEKGCNKVAFGHHLDDVVETFFMNLFMCGQINCFKPITYFSRQQIYLIRPLIFVLEEQIKKVLKRLNYIPIKNLCPKDRDSYRQTIKNFLNNQEKNDKGFKKRIFNAMRKNGKNGWGFIKQNN